ncbi:MAG: hypothetical protein KOO62_02025 [candidate division Zixibacteria bacterium]|nr:hypothetical protein [candidate division Zixibacteria bacterium]
MKSICLLLGILFMAVPIVAQESATFDEAKQQSLNQDKPLLLEFFRDE